MPGGEARVKVVALHHARDGVARGKFNEAACAKLLAPLAVVAQLGFVGVKHLEGLLAVGFGVRLYLLGGERRARAVAPARVADARREVANQEDDGVPQVLQLAQLGEHDGVPKVNVGRGGVQAELDAQWLAAGRRARQLAYPVGFKQQLVAAAQGDGERLAHFGRAVLCAGGR